MKIGLLVEGQTEEVFVPHLRRYLEENHMVNMMPRLVSYPQKRRLPTHEKLRRTVDRLLNGPGKTVDHLIALTDVYTGDNPPLYVDAADAKSKMRQWVGPESRFHPHAAQYDFEAWLLPYWKDIQRLAGHNQSVPSSSPESVNHGNPPAQRIKTIFERGTCGKSYSKTRDGGRLLRDNDLGIAVAHCPELRSLVNTILSICDRSTIP